MLAQALQAAHGICRSGGLVARWPDSSSIWEAAAARRMRSLSRSCSLPLPVSTSAPSRRAAASQLSACAAIVEATLCGSTSIETTLAQMIPIVISCTRETTMSKVNSGVATIGNPSSATV
jgi:hypothetical protein